MLILFRARLATENAGATSGTALVIDGPTDSVVDVRGASEHNLESVDVDLPAYDRPRRR